MDSLRCGAAEGFRISVGSDRVKNKELVHRVNKERNILRTVRRRKANCIVHISGRELSTERYVIEGKIEGNQ